MENEDYDQCGSVNNPTEGATRVDIGDITISQYNSWTLNATGIEWIDKTGITKLGTREGHDCIDSTVSAGGAGGNNIIVFASEATGTDRDPYLEVTTLNTAPSATFDNNFSGLGNRRCNGQL